MRPVLCVLLAACWSSPPPSPTARVTTPVVEAPSTTPASAPEETDASAANDDATGEEVTVLNSRRWSYAAYFNRVKRKIADHWHPEATWQALDAAQRGAYGTTTRTTTVEIEIDPDGSLKAIKMVAPSGAGELDAEAFRAIQTAAPYEPPPAALNPLRFTFGFSFEIGPQTKTTTVVP